MRIAELSATTGVSVPTIKYYLRAGLLPAGELTSRNQANYGQEHVRRLHLVRALVDIGGLSIATVTEVLDAIDTPQDSLHCLLGLVQYGMAAPKPPTEGEALDAARAAVADLVRRRGWHTDPENAFGEALAAALSAATAIGHGGIVDLLDPYADACERIATAELESIMHASGEQAPSGASGGLERLVERMAIGTVLGDTIIAALRRLAHQHASAVMFGEGDKESEKEAG